MLSLFGKLPGKISTKIRPLADHLLNTQIFLLSPCMKYVQYRLRVCSTGWGCAVQAKSVQYGLKVCSTSWGKIFVLHPSACTAHPQPVLRAPQPVLWVPQPVLHTLSLYLGRASAWTAHPQPVLHLLYAGCLLMTSAWNMCRSGIHLHDDFMIFEHPKRSNVSFKFP